AIGRDSRPGNLRGQRIKLIRPRALCTATIASCLSLLARLNQLRHHLRKLMPRDPFRSVVAQEIGASVLPADHVQGVRDQVIRPAALAASLADADQLILADPYLQLELHQQTFVLPNRSKQIHQLFGLSPEDRDVLVRALDLAGLYILDE